LTTNVSGKVTSLELCNGSREGWGHSFRSCEQLNQIFDRI